MSLHMFYNLSMCVDSCAYTKKNHNTDTDTDDKNNGNLCDATHTNTKALLGKIVKGSLNRSENETQRGGCTLQARWCDGSFHLSLCCRFVSVAMGSGNI